MIARPWAMAPRSLLLRAAAGCLLGALAVACGPAAPRPARLDAAKATAIEVGLVGDGRRFCPGGEARQLEIVVATSDGQRLDTWSRGEGRGGKLPFTVFEYTTTWGQIDGDGFVRLPDDPIAAIGRVVTVEVRVAERPDLVGQVALEPDFGCGGTLGGLGARGGSGWGGQVGADGRPGQAGTTTRDGAPASTAATAATAATAGRGGGPHVTAALTYVTAATGQRLAALRCGPTAGVDHGLDLAGNRWAVVAPAATAGRAAPVDAAAPAGGRRRDPRTSSTTDASGDEVPGNPGTAGGSGGDGAAAATVARRRWRPGGTLESCTTRPSPSWPSCSWSTPAAVAAAARAGPARGPVAPGRRRAPRPRRPSRPVGRAGAAGRDGPAAHGRWCGQARSPSASPTWSPAGWSPPADRGSSPGNSADGRGFSVELGV
ncbi:MAG: hypothetical protein HS111_24330 [Kofleriaceae bacterium]|nr:hypothetical protein [Kofleriaceae bacterium]